MEQFNVPHQRVREKNVYLLHLDTARIVLISAAVIGIIIVSFLLGMNFVKGGSPSKMLVTDGDIFDGHKDLDLLKNNLPEASDEDAISKPLGEKIIPGDKDETIASPGRETARQDEKSGVIKPGPADPMTKNTAGEGSDTKVVAGRKSAGDTEKKKISRADDDGTPVRAAKKSADGIPKKKKNASRVIEVSGDHASSGRKTATGRYTVQVASYDGRSRAQSEVRALQDLRFDAYLDETRLNGKPYFRVRVGQLTSRKKALDILKDIQERERYQDSYLVRE